MKRISKTLDEISSDPSLTFKKLDSLKDSDNKSYEKFVKLEESNEEVFKYARALEGSVRGFGVHAGGLLVAAEPINDYFPTRVEKGRKVTLWDKDIVEQKKAVKLDFLGLNTISIIYETLQNIELTTGVKITMQELYDNKDIRNDKETFKLICSKDTEAIFQFESDLFKGVISDMQPENINDLIALTSLCR